ncbi:MAG: acetylornithine deacetylase [Pseudomonadota bacterium]
MAKLPALEQQLKTLIGLPSISSCSAAHDQSNRAVIEQLASWLSELGFNCEILPLSDKPNKANLIATLGSGSGGLVLSGHTDTVPYDDGKWQSDPFSLSERDNRFYGLGTSDMKGFFAVAIEAVRKYTAKDLNQPIILLATADEESSMQGARELAASGRPKARYAIVGEPTSLRPIRMHKGIMMDKVTVHGRSGHSSNPAAGASAMDVMHSVLGELMGFRQRLAKDFNHAGFEVNVPTMNLGCIHGGDNPNRICGQCELQFDVRALPGMDNAGLRADIAALIDSIAHRHEVHIDYQPLVDGVPAYEQAADSELVKTAEKLTGHTAGSVAFGTEAPFFQSMGMETIVLGPGSIDQAHQPDEYMELHQIKPCVKLLSQFIERFCIN